QPSAGAFLDEYKRLREKYQLIYSVHLSGKFSGTCASAEVARSQIDGVKVVDSLLATGGIALLVDRILARIDQGVTDVEMDDYIAHFLAKHTFTFLPTTLDQLHKGGRIGHASHLVGTLLNIKPVLTIEDGVIEVYKKVRGVRQALEAMVAGMLEATESGGTCYVSLSHGLNEPVLEQMRALLAEVTDRDLQIRFTSIVGAVIGTYVGPGAIALCCIQE
ncbi:MAG: DegV family protein, partial [Thermoleophilia bacterium]|nr:DegV family protein [Thermoleophilia bacterium]